MTEDAADRTSEEAAGIVAQLDAYARSRALEGLADLHWPWVAACAALGFIFLFTFFPNVNLPDSVTSKTPLNGLNFREAVTGGTISQYPEPIGSRTVLFIAAILVFIGVFLLPRWWSIRFREAMVWRRYTDRGLVTLSPESVIHDWRAASSSAEKLLRKDDLIALLWFFPIGTALFGFSLWLRTLELADVQTVSARGFETAMFWTSRRIPHGFDQVKWVSLQCGEIKVGGRGGTWVTMARVTYRFQNTHRITLRLPSDRNEKFEIMLAIDEALRRQGTQFKFDKPYSQECVETLTRYDSPEFAEAFARILHLDDWRGQ